MAPLPDSLPDSIIALLPRSLRSEAPTINNDPRTLSPLAVHDLHTQKRDVQQLNPGAGSRPATDFNNKGIQALFALIGVGMVLTSIWFFFWAKNGGFKWRQGDWEDYKSTVLRRKGPDGKTLSNATKSTKLGGGSVVHGGTYGAESVGYTDETGTSADFSEMREVEAGHGRGFGLRGGDARKNKKERHKNNLKDADMREYRQEKAARVGGLNRQADGQYVDYSNTEPSELGSNVSQQPLTKPKDKKKEAKAKERRAKERMKEAHRNEKVAAKQAAAEAKAQKSAEKAQAKKDKADQKKNKKDRAETEATPSEAPTVPQPPQAARRAPPSGAYSFTTGDDTNTVYTGAYTDNRTAPSEYNESSYYSDYRPNAEPKAFAHATRSNNSTPNRRERRSESRSRQSSPRKHRSSRPPPSNTDMFSQVLGDEQGTKAYPCHIPGLSSAGSVGVSESVSQVGGPSSGRRQGRDVMDGYRRGGVRTVGRRDSLSDSDA